MRVWLLRCGWEPMRNKLRGGREGARRKGWGGSRWDCPRFPGAPVLGQSKGATTKAWERKEKRSGERKIEVLKEQDRSVRMFLPLSLLSPLGPTCPQCFRIFLRVKYSVHCAGKESSVAQAKHWSRHPWYHLCFHGMFVPIAIFPAFLLFSGQS